MFSTASLLLLLLIFKARAQHEEFSKSSSKWVQGSNFQAYRLTLIETELKQ